MGFQWSVVQKRDQIARFLSRFKVVRLVRSKNAARLEKVYLQIRGQAGLSQDLCGYRWKRSSEPVDNETPLTPHLPSSADHWHARLG